MSATDLGGLSTFLLEMALDQARAKARLAAVLKEERTRRAKPHQKRLTQPEMAAFLGYSLRHYQRLENAEDGTIPDYADLVELLGKLDRTIEEVYDAIDTALLPLPEGPSSEDREQRVSRLESQVEEALELLYEIVGRPRQQHGSARGSSSDEPA